MELLEIAAAGLATLGIWKVYENYRVFDLFEENAKREISILKKAQDRYDEKHKDDKPAKRSDGLNLAGVIDFTTGKQNLAEPFYYDCEIIDRNHEIEFYRRAKFNPFVFDYMDAHRRVTGHPPRGYMYFTVPKHMGERNRNGGIRIAQLVS